MSEANTMETKIMEAKSINSSRFRAEIGDKLIELLGESVEDCNAQSTAIHYCRALVTMGSVIEALSLNPRAYAALQDIADLEEFTEATDTWLPYRVGNYIGATSKDR